MTPFALASPRTWEQASELLADRRFSLPVLKAGGMDVVDHLKEGLIEPDVLINVKRLRREGVKDEIGPAEGGGLRIEAGATMARMAASDLLRRRGPVLSQALEGAATPQVRNVGTAAGNLLQRPRCWYYRNDQFACLKKGGHTCYAANGENRYHAIFGEGPCHIVHPSNLAPALVVCDAIIHVIGGDRETVRIADLYHMPDKGIRDEHNLGRTEVVTHITCAEAPASGFYAIKEKQSFDWPLVMAAVALELDGDRIKAARVCAGAVAPIPWALPAVDRALAGLMVDDATAVRKAAAVAVEGARPMTDNAYKLRLLPVAIHRAVLRAAGRPAEGTP